MAVNLVGWAGQRAAALLESSFAQFQADRAVVGITRQARRARQAIQDAAASCELGDFTEYAALRRRLSQLEADQSRQRSAARRADALATRGAAAGRHHPGPQRQAGGLAVVLDHGMNGNDIPLPLVLTATPRQAAVGDGLPGAGDAHRPDPDTQLVQRPLGQAPQGSRCHGAQQARRA